MASKKDPVCGMTVDPGHAAGESTYGGQTFAFCSSDCLKKFEANPARYAIDEPEGQQAAFETHEPPHTRMGSGPLRKFGSAGGGGLEREPGPETHVSHASPPDRKD